MSMNKVPKSELRILQVLWMRQRQSAKEIADVLKRDGHEINISSVQTLLRRLEARGLVDHEEDGKSFQFSATAKPSDVRTAHAKDFLDSMFGGALTGFVAQLVDEEEVSDDELRELRKLVDSKLKERKRK